MNGKDGLASKTFWGAFFLVAAVLLDKFGIHIDPTGWATDMAGLMGAFLTIYGRVKANTSITSFAGLTTVKPTAPSDAAKSTSSGA